MPDRPAEPRVTEAAPAPEDVYYEHEMLRAAAAFFDAGQYEDMEDVLREALRLPPVAVPGPASARPSRIRLLWNRLQAKLHHSYPCGKCGYAYNCPDGECHS